MGGIFGGGSSHTTVKEEAKPDIPSKDRDKLWNEFMDMYFGTPATTVGGGASVDTSDIDQEISQLQRKLNEGNLVWDQSVLDRTQKRIDELNTEKANRIAQAQGEQKTIPGSPGMRAMMQEDLDAKKAAEQAYLDTLGGTTNTRIEDINKAYAPYSSYLTRLRGYGSMRAPTVSIGGGTPIPFEGGYYRNQTRRADAANTSLYNAAANKSNLINSLLENLAQKKAQFGTTYTPNASDIAYISGSLEPLAQWAAGATKTESGSLPGQSPLGVLGNILGLASGIGGLYSSFMTPATTSLGTAGTAAFAAPNVASAFGANLPLLI